MRCELPLLLVMLVLVASSGTPTKRLDKLIELLDGMKSHETWKTEENALFGASREAAASKWMAKTNEEYREWTRRSSLVYWDYMTNLTDENAAKTSVVSNQLSDWLRIAIEEGKDHVTQSTAQWDSSLVRQLNTLSNLQGTPVAKESATQNKITQLSVDLEGLYGNAVVTKEGKEYHMEPEFTEIMATSRDWDELLWAWVAWRNATGPFMKDKYTEATSLMNQAAVDNNYDNLGSAWRYANYEMDQDLIDMVDDLYDDVKPLYEQIHAYVRGKLIEAYPDHDIDPEGPIPAHILGNMWAQEWNNILDIVLPYPDSASYDVTEAMQNQGYTVEKLFRLSESFFASLGMDNMTDTFWEKSMMTKPDGRNVECHGSASDMASADCSDFRIKMCTQITQDYLQTVHHEMGHIQYFMQYCHQPFVFQSGANAAFHEAIGDTIALSVMSPEHLKTIGLIEEQGAGSDDEQQKKTLNFLMKAALEKVAFLPFGYLIDKWRWDVFSGEITPEEYNTKWWQYRIKYQGVAPPVRRSDNDFDPGSKYHVPANVPYIRYFLSFIGQFQFHESLCSAAGHKGPLHACDIYRSKDAGRLLMSVLSRGSSRPWKETMQVMTGGKQFSADAIKEYFAPLTKWIQKQNKHSKIGW